LDSWSRQAPLRLPMYTGATNPTQDPATAADITDHVRTRREIAGRPEQTGPGLARNVYGEVSRVRHRPRKKAEQGSIKDHVECNCERHRHCPPNRCRLLLGAMYASHLAVSV